MGSEVVTLNGAENANRTRSYRLLPDNRREDSFPCQYSALMNNLNAHYFTTGISLFETAWTTSLGFLDVRSTFHVGVSRL